MKIGKTIKVLRIAADMSQQDMALKLDISPSFLSLIESDKREPSLSLLEKIAGLVNLPVSILIFQAADAPAMLNNVQSGGYAKTQALMLNIVEHMICCQQNREAITK